MIIRSDDGGATWASIFTNETGFPISDITFVDRDNGWMVTAARRVHRSRDGGLTWTPAPSIPVEEPSFLQLSKVQFFDALHGVIFAFGNEEGTLLFHTTDGGESWVQSTLRPAPSSPSIPVRLGNVCFTASGLGVAVGSGRVDRPLDRFLALYVSHDIGRTWEDVSGRLPGASPVLSGQVEAFACAGNEGFWVASALRDDAGAPAIPGVFYSPDGGLTWVDRTSMLIPNPGLNPAIQTPRAIGFANEAVGWAIVQPEILTTNDGGATWAPQADIDLGNTNLWNVTLGVADAARAIVVGNTILFSGEFGGDRGLNIALYTEDGGQDGWIQTGFPEGIFVFSELTVVR